MNDLIVKFGGMSLFVSGQRRSETLMMNTDGGPHKHEHAIFIGDSTKPIIVSEAVIWIEQDQRRLTGALVDAAERIVRLRDFTPHGQLHSTLTIEDPTRTFAWRTRVNIWFRLPGGDLTTETGNSPGEKVIWNIAPFDEEPAKKRQLSELTVVTRGDIQGDVRVAILSLNAGETRFVEVPRDADGNYMVCFITRYAGDLHTEPKPGQRVELTELELIYNCLDSGRGPIPFVENWPTLKGVRLSPWTDPATGICPPATIPISA